MFEVKTEIGRVNSNCKISCSVRLLRCTCIVLLIRGGSFVCIHQAASSGFCALHKALHRLRRYLYIASTWACNTCSIGYPCRLPVLKTNFSCANSFNIKLTDDLLDWVWKSHFFSWSPSDRWFTWRRAYFFINSKQVLVIQLTCTLWFIGDIESYFHVVVFFKCQTMKTVDGKKGLSWSITVDETNPIHLIQ